MAAYEAVPVHEPVAEQVIVKSTGSPSRESGSVTVEGSSSGDNVFQVAQDWVISRAKPLLEFLDSRRINLPPLSEIAERVKKNIDRYFYNYTIVATGAFALQAISHPIQTVLFGLVAYFWSYKLYKNDKKVFAGIVTLIASAVFGFIPVLMGTATLASVAILGHAALMKPIESNESEENA